MDKSNHCRICGGLKYVTIEKVQSKNCTTTISFVSTEELCNYLDDEYSVREVYCGTCGIMYSNRSI